MHVPLGFYVFGYHKLFLRESLFSAILTGIGSTLFFINQSLQGTLFVELTLATVKSKDTSKLLAQMRLFLGAVAFACGLVWIVGHIGLVYSPLETSIAFARSFVIAYAYVNVVSLSKNVV
jgi:hypothetical protein